MTGPLQNAAYEAFAQAIAKGEKAVDAYARMKPKATRKTCYERGSRLAKSDKIAARIAEIRSMAAEANRKAEQQATKEAAKKLKVTLLTMGDRRRLMAEIVNDPDADHDTRMKAAMNDAKLAGDLIDKTDLTSEGTALPSAMPTITIIEAQPCGRRAKQQAR